MIARIWHGYTSPEHADAYEAMLKPEPLPGLGKIKGYRGSYVLRRNSGSEVEFITILLWDSIEAIRAVAGTDYETAVGPGSHAAKFSAATTPRPCITKSLRCTESQFNFGARAVRGNAVPLPSILVRIDVSVITSNDSGETYSWPM